MSCPALDACTAVGYYAHGYEARPMAFGQTAGVWGSAIKIVLPADAATGFGAQGGRLNSVWCDTPGNCVAVGSYENARGGVVPLAVNEVAGVWQQAASLSLPADGAAAYPGRSDLRGVSCVRAGDCVAVGSYSGSGATRALVVNETDGTWSQATPIDAPSDGDPANAAPWSGPSLAAVSCPGDDNCTAVGSYSRSSGDDAAIAVSESGGVWKPAEEISLPADAGTQYQSAQLRSVICLAAGACDAVGSYRNWLSGDMLPQYTTEAMTVSQDAGVWAQAHGAHLPAGSDPYENAELESIACLPDRSCVAVGRYTAAKQAVMAEQTVPPLRILTTRLPDAVAGSSYHAQLLAAGGQPPYSWYLPDEPLPTGLRMTATGAISGIPAAAGTTTFTVAALDSLMPGHVVTRRISLTTAALPGPLTTGTPPPPGATVARASIDSRRRTARFIIRTTGRATGLQCALDRVTANPRPRPRFRSCRSPARYGHLAVGRYVFYARALGPGGIETSPAIRRFAIHGHRHHMGSRPAGS